MRGSLSARAVPGAQLVLRVTPAARRNAVEELPDGRLKVQVTAPPEDGRANDAVRRLLARALGVAPSRLTLVSGAQGRDKVFRLDEP
jgi:uncharacterized protein (TIGR00251 family)